MQNPVKTNYTILKYISALLFIGLLAAACSRDYQPKPIGYNRLALPPPAYQSSPDTLPYGFEYSQFARFVTDSSSKKEQFGVEIYYPELKATIHLTYKKIYHQEKLLKEYMQDAYVLTAKHQVKAYAIDESIVKTPSGKTAIIAELEGEVPSQFQFTLTDSTDNFLRGAVYFNVKVQNDSLQPAIEYMKKDAMHLVNTLMWKR